MKDNEAARGLNILNSLYLKKAALKSIQNQKMYFADPLKLKQGGAGTLGRLPVLQDNEFSGFSAEISKLKDLLKSSGSYNIDRSKYYFQFTKINPTTKKKVYYLPKETKYSKNCSVSLFMADGDGNYT
jgi:sensor domain CHASE-containing protein